jgi:hypothetical protein
MPAALSPKTRLPLLLLLAAAIGAPSQHARAVDPALPRAFELNPDLVAGWLRIGGKAGDLVLRNRTVTAIVRKRDGWLLDFFPNDGGVSSAPQLKGLTQVDGLWQLHPVLHDGNTPINLTSSSVRIAGDTIEAESQVGLGAGTLRVTTSYRLDADQPRLLMTSRFRHVGGGKVAHLSFGDSVKWGNVDYFVDGRGRVPGRYSAQGRWIGRRGAGGDLVLRTLERTPMRIHYEAQHYGLAPAIVTSYLSAAVASGETLDVQRSLAYEPIAEPAATERPSGTLEVEIRDENGRPLAAKLSLRGERGTPDPDFGNDGDESGAGRFVWSGVGRFSRKLPAGNYRVLATAGIERDAAGFSAEIRASGVVRFERRLERVVATPGFVSADLHLHQAPSVDADIACSTRVISIAAEGIEFAVASDHYTVQDLGPAVAALTNKGLLASRLITMAGTEVSTVGHRFGHFNLYPAPAKADIKYENTTPRQMFAEMRKVSPRGLIQVNHPRWHDLGYFHRYRLDPKSGRVPVQFKNDYDPSFDVLEIYNGVDSVSEPKTRQILLDWLHLLGQGHRYTATGNSDSHKLFFVDPGLPRNLIRWGKATSDSEDLNASPEAIVDAIRRGQVSVTSGPVIDFEILGKGPGETVRGGGSRLPARLRVRAAPWIDVSEVEVLVGPQARRIRWLPAKRTSDVVRVDAAFDLILPAKTFVVVVARGERELPNVFLPKVRPYAFTNPVWIEP